MKTTTKIFLNAVSSRFWPEVILATLISLFSVLSLLFHIWRDFIQKVIREGVSFWVFLSQEWLVLIPLFSLIAILTCLFYYRLLINKSLVNVALKFIERDEDVIYFLANYIVSRGKSKPGYLSENYVSDIRFIMELSKEKLKLVDIDSLEILLGAKIDDIDNIVNDYENNGINANELEEVIKEIEEITKEENLKEILFLLDLAREPSFSAALRKLAGRIEKLSDDLYGFANKFCFLEKKSELRRGYNPMSIIKREIREGLRNINRLGNRYVSKFSDPRDVWCNRLRLQDILIEGRRRLDDGDILDEISKIFETFNKSEEYSKLLLECVLEGEIKKRKSDILNFTNNVLFTYGYSVSILDVLDLDIIDFDDKRKIDIYLIKAEERTTISGEEERMRKRLIAKYYPSPSICSVNEIMSMNSEDFRGRDIIFLLGIELINEKNQAFQTYNAGKTIEEIIKNFKDNGDTSIKVILIGESYKVFDFRDVKQISGRRISSSLLHPEYIDYIFTDHGFHILDKNGYWTVLGEHKQVNTDFKYEIYSSACYCKANYNPKYLSCCEDFWSVIKSNPSIIKRYLKQKGKL